MAASAASILERLDQEDKERVSYFIRLLLNKSKYQQLKSDRFVTFLHHKIDSAAPEKAVGTSIQNVKEEILAICRHCAALPLLDSRTPDQILGYNEK